MKAVVIRLNMVWTSLIVLSLMAAGVSDARISPENTVAIWLFDDGEGDVAEDSSGNGHDGKIAAGVKWVKGKFDTALEFPGAIPQIVTVPHEESLTLDTWSVTAWIKADAESTGGWQTILGKTSRGNNRNYAVHLHMDTGVFKPHFTEGVDNYKVVAGQTGLYDSEWHHVAGTYDKEFVRAYVDGILEAKGAYNNTPDTHDAPLTIGSLNTVWEPFKGVIDDVGVFNEGLTEDDVKEIMDRGLATAIGIIAVSPSGKLATTWARIRVQDQALSDHYSSPSVFLDR